VERGSHHEQGISYRLRLSKAEKLGGYRMEDFEIAILCQLLMERVWVIQPNDRYLSGRTSGNPTSRSSEANERGGNTRRQSDRSQPSTAAIGCMRSRTVECTFSLFWQRNGGLLGRISTNGQLFKRTSTKAKIRAPQSITSMKTWQCVLQLKHTNV
jgi:hypothetical protein